MEFNSAFKGLTNVFENRAVYEIIWRPQKTIWRMRNAYWMPKATNTSSSSSYIFHLVGHLLTRSGLTYPEVSSKVYHDSFCQLGNSISLPWVIYFEAFYLHVISSFSCIPVICPKLVLFLTRLQFVHLFCNLSKCILLFFSCISSLLLLVFWRPLLQ